MIARHVERVDAVRKELVQLLSGSVERFYPRENRYETVPILPRGLRVADARTERSGRTDAQITISLQSPKAPKPEVLMRIKATVQRFEWLAKQDALRHDGNTDEEDLAIYLCDRILEEIGLHVLQRRPITLEI